MSPSTKRLAILALSTAGCTLDPLPCGDAACDLASYPGPDADVVLARDGLGVVHVSAASDPDAFFGDGYAQARDRLFQMDLTRRQALGRRAEVFGEEAVFGDRLVRTAGVRVSGRAAAEQIRASHPDEHQLLVAWTAGVNAYIGEVLRGEAPLPIGFSELGFLPEPWEVADGLTVGKLMLFGNANQIEYELLATILRDYFPEIAARLPLLMPLTDTFVLPPEERPLSPTSGSLGEKPAIAPRKMPADAAARLAKWSQEMAPFRPGASNNWAIDGRHTDNGQPFIAGDPHQGLRSPSLMWAHHLRSAAGLDVIGFSFVGSPAVQLGHNRDLIWTATTTYPDVMDMLEVQFDGETVDLFGERLPVSPRTERIAVRDGDPIDIVVEEISGLGVLLPDGIAPVPVVDAGNRILLRWPGLAATREGEAFLGIDRAASLDAWESAVEVMEIGNFNFIAADAGGIAYRSNPLVPVRQALSPNMPPYSLLDGDDPNNAWVGTLSTLPRSRAVQRGWIASANNDPFGLTADGSIDGDPFYFGVFFDPGTRAARVESEIERLLAEGPVDRAAMEALQLDTHAVIADLLLPVLDAVYATVDDDPALEAFRDRADLEALITQMQSWDRRMDRDSAGAVTFHAFAWFLAERILRDDLSLAFDSIASASGIYLLKWAVLTVTERFPAAGDLMQEGRAFLVMGALDDAAAYLVDRFGADTSQYRWGNWHFTAFPSVGGDALAVDRVATDGADGTVNVSAATFFSDGAAPYDLVSTGGAIYRMVATFDEGGAPQAWVNFPRGNAGEPDSPHWDDTLEAWVEGQYARLPFTAAEVEAAATERAVVPARTR
jgi:penicillin G amidase